MLLTAAVCKSNEGVYEHAPLHGIHESFFNLRSIKAEDNDFDALLGLLDAFDQSVNTVPGLN
jgi:hypothetical protein